MASKDPSFNRNIIPTWRTYEETAKAGELEFSKTKDTPIQFGRFKDYVTEWQRHRCVSTASDLVNAGLVSGNTAIPEVLESASYIKSHEDYVAMTEKLEELVEGDKNIASEIRVFIPEIFAKLTLGYREGDSLFLLEGEGDEQQSIEFKKTQLRTYFYLQQAVLEYLSGKPSQEEVSRIVTNSVAFRELRKAIDAAKENGKELKPDDLFVPGTSYKIGHEGYRVW